MCAETVQLRGGRLRVRPDEIRVRRSPTGVVRGTVRWIREGDGSVWQAIGASTGVSALFGFASRVPDLLEAAASGSLDASFVGTALAVLGLVPLAAVGFRVARDRTVPLADVERVEVGDEDDERALTVVREGDGGSRFSIGGDGEETFRPITDDALEEATRALRVRGVRVDRGEA